MLSILITSTLYIFFSNTENKSKYSIDIKKFKAFPNDNLEDTDQIQSAINYLGNNGGGTIEFSSGTYLIDSIKSIRLKSNITLKFEKNSILKSLPNNAEGYEIIRIYNVKNIKLLGGVKIVGERNEHLGIKGEWGIGISIKGSKRIYIENSIITNCWGDGIYVGKSNTKLYSKDITLKNIKFENNRRQGISIVSVINLKAINIIANNTNGTKPSSGIDLEPNNQNEYMKNVVIIKLSTKNNEGYGLLFALGRLSESPNSIDIRVSSTKDIKDNIGLFIPNRITGKIKIGDEYILNTTKEK